MPPSTTDLPEADLRWSELLLRNADGRVSYLAPWCATIRVDGREHTLSATEWLMLCAAAELDRVWPADLRRLLRRRRDSAISWASMMDGALGLTPKDAAGDMPIREVFARVDAELVRFETTVSRAMEVA